RLGPFGRQQRLDRRPKIIRNKGLRHAPGNAPHQVSLDAFIALPTFLAASFVAGAVVMGDRVDAVLRVQVKLRLAVGCSA
ncbi:hypothetical protein QMO56_19655, partial [Roseomonas sp. E05]|uniref:hypothetical protein n=1 Tax=Roseomonas sp. E05 TaxID=3046310 RepID=UPI0024BB82D7